ncbi:MAG: DUF1934 domain-containing protein [Ruminiclostridium sp.]
MRNVNVSILSKIRTDDGEDTTEFFTSGSYELGEKGYILRYDESDGIGYESCKVKITVTDKAILIERSGPAAASLTIEAGVKHHCVYGTPYGEFTMGINAYEVESELNDEGGRLRFRYSIDVNSDFISENEMHITIS